MHAYRHALLSALPLAHRRVLQAAAAAAGVSVDALVQAGLQRGGSAAAVGAANALKVNLPDLFSMADAWPHVCKFCHADVGKPPPLPCAFCKARGCSDCVTSAGCPTCKEEARLRGLKAAAASAERVEHLALLENRDAPE